MAAWDCTYLLQVRGMLKGDVVGGAWTPQNPGNARLQIADGVDFRSMKKVTDMFPGSPWMFSYVFGGVPCCLVVLWKQIYEGLVGWGKPFYTPCLWLVTKRSDPL